MPKIITYVDSGVLITAAHGQDPVLQSRALALLNDPQREYASSAYVRLEVMPKAVWVRNLTEQTFYEAYFRDVRHWLTDYHAVIAEAEAEAGLYGLGSMDALHVAAAVRLNADELVTIEKPTKSIFRTKASRSFLCAEVRTAIS